MAEAAEALAVLVAGGEPTIFGRMIGPEIDIAVLLLDQQRRRGAAGDFGIVGPQEIERIGIEVLDHAKARDAAPGIHDIQRTRHR